MGIRFYIFCLLPASHLCESTLSQLSALYLFYENTVLRFVQYCFVSIKYSYYCKLFCLRSASNFCYQHHHMWVRFICTKKSTTACISSLLLSIYLWCICYLILFPFKLTNGAKVIFFSRILNLLICFIFDTTFFLIIKNKEILISYCNTSFFAFIFRNS